MIKHIVMFKLKPEENIAENFAKAKELLADFESEIPTLKKLHVGINSSDAPDSNYEIALICDFDDINGLNEYQVHPKHIEFGEFIKPIRDSRACIDYEY